jgi:tRNA(Arg) A34 adenosine deaminase TadA
MDYFALAVEETIKGMQQGISGPFGATIIRGDEVIAAVPNRQRGDMDPSQHAEMVAVREACKKLGTMDLSDCTVYATCEPCPMCVSVMIWAGIRTVYYASTRYSADKYGFTDDHLRRYLAGEDDSVIDMIAVEPREDCENLFIQFHELNPPTPDPAA